MSITKCYHLRFNVGRVRYAINYWDGVKLNRDGSPFFALQTCSSKKAVSKFVRKLESEGYVER